jgi:adenylate cyclase, class 2
MPIEIEKKYRLTGQQRDRLLRLLPEIAAGSQVERFEENILFSGPGLESARAALRLRRLSDGAILTYKQRIPSNDAVKHQHEEETEVADAEATIAILKCLGFTPRLVYEKRRSIWKVRDAEVVLDELPFGLFMEIEGSEADINAIERQLDIPDLEPEHATYPHLTQLHGRANGPLIEARFTT